MKKFSLIGILFTILFASTSWGAEAEVQRSFTLNVPLDKLVKYIEENGNSLADATGVKIISKKGNQVKVSKSNRKGKFVFTIQEYVKKNPGKVYYKSSLVDCETKNVDLMTTQIWASASGNVTEVEVLINAQVNQPRVKDLDVRIDLSWTIQRVRGTLESTLK